MFIKKDTFIYVYNKQVLVGHLLFGDFELYGIIFINACVVITVAMVMLLRDFASYGIKFMCV
jgi:hypothetical protein